MKLFPVLCMLICSFAGHGQQLRNELGDVYYEPNFYTSQYAGTEGSPYLSEAFIPARIDDMDKTYLVRFNAVDGTTEVMVSEQQVLVLDNSRKHVIALKDGSDRVYETLGYLNGKGDADASFFELIHQAPEFRLYLREEKKFFRKVKAQGYAAEQPARFEKVRDAFYMSDFPGSSDRLIPVPDKIKPFAALFGENAASVRKFIKDNKLSLDEPDDLVRILHYALAPRG